MRIFLDIDLKKVVTLVQEVFSTPLFPLSAHLLPGGRMALRIFEPRYVRMVKEACAAQSGIGICMQDCNGDKSLNEHICSIGTYAEIEDFTLLDDGLLGITVKGLRCFSIDSIMTEDDGLRRGECAWLESWPVDVAIEQISPIDKRLKEVFDKYPEVSDLYPETHFDDPLWVVYRWLEILPVKVEHKQEFLKQNDCGKAVEYLSHLLK